MAVDKALRSTSRENPVPEFTGVVRHRAGRDLAGNMGTEDVRGRLTTRIITLLNAAGADTFKLRAKFQDGHTADADTAALNDDESAANVQAALRTATGDSGLTVGLVGQVYTVTFSSTPHREDVELQAVECVGCSVEIKSAAPTYVSSKGLPGEVHRHGTDTGVTTASTPGRGASLDVPLGESIVTDGPGQTAQTTLVAPAVTASTGGDDAVTFAATEAASGGTGANVGYAIFKTDDDSPAPVVYTEDADGTITISGLEDATDYYVIAFTQTQTGTSGEADEASRVSAPSDPQYFTTT